MIIGLIEQAGRNRMRLKKRSKGQNGREIHIITDIVTY